MSDKDCKATCPRCGSHRVEVEPEHEEGRQVFCFDCGYGSNEEGNKHGND